MREKWECDKSNNDSRFQYACALSRSCGIHAEDDKKQAVDHFMYLVHNGIFVRDSLFNLALTEYSLADYEKARNHCEDLYRQDPDNKQVSYWEIVLLIYDLLLILYCIVFNSTIYLI